MKIAMDYKELSQYKISECTNRGFLNQSKLVLTS
jgi:hypothetical protein